MNTPIEDMPTNETNTTAIEALLKGEAYPINPFHLPPPPRDLVSASQLASLSEGVRCPVCGQLYGDQTDGFMHAPCDHLIAHVSSAGWEHAPDPKADRLDGSSTLLRLARLEREGGLLVRVETDDEIDWLVWQAPNPAALHGQVA